MEAMAITKEMRESKQNKIDDIVSKINASIKRAVDRGWDEAVFDCDKKSPYYKEVRETFERAGYRIKPTGYIDGVLQLTEDITW